MTEKPSEWIGLLFPGDFSSISVMEWCFSSLMSKLDRHIVICIGFDPYKGIQDSLGLWIPRKGFRIPVTGFRILCQWNLESSGFQMLVGFRIPWAVFRFPRPRISIPQAKVFTFRIPQAKIVPDSGIRYPLHGANEINFFHSSQQWEQVFGPKRK